MEELQVSNSYDMVGIWFNLVAIKDPNHDLTLWETGAIIQYLIEHYDTKKKLTYSSLRERALINQYIMFQMSGQGPYFGQASW